MQREVIRNLRKLLREANQRHYDLSIAPDMRLEELQRELEESKSNFAIKEAALLKELQRLRQCLQDEAQTARESIDRLENREQELMRTVVQMQKERYDSISHKEDLQKENETLIEKLYKYQTTITALQETKEALKQRNECLDVDLSYARKVQSESEARSKKEIELLCAELKDLKAHLLIVEKQNSDLELNNESLKQQLIAMQQLESENEELQRLLKDELETKAEIVQYLELRLQAMDSKGTTGKNLAEELEEGLCEEEEGPAIDKESEMCNTFEEAAENAMTDDKSNFQPDLPDRVPVTNLRDARNYLGKAILSVESTVDIFSSGSAASITSLAHKVEALADKLLSNAAVDDTNILKNIEQLIQAGVCDSGDYKPLEKGALASFTDMLDTFDWRVEEPLHEQESFCLEESLEKYMLCESFKDKQKQNTCTLAAEVGMCQHAAKYGGSLANFEKAQSFCLRCSAMIHSSSIFRRGESGREPQNISIESNICPQNLISESLKIPGSEQKQPKIKCVDRCTQITIVRVDYGMQFDSDDLKKFNWHTLPRDGKELMKLLEGSLKGTVHASASKFIEAVAKRCSVDEDFRDSLKILKKLVGSELLKKTTTQIWDNDTYFNTISAIRALKKIYRPLPMLLLDRIEQRVHKQVHSLMESKLSCTVYYPIPRAGKKKGGLAPFCHDDEKTDHECA